jgi:hypothetical protein
MALPAIISVSPPTGPLSGGTPVTISGSGFTGATAVTFGGTAATALAVVSDTIITCTTPPHAAGNVSVAVTSPGGTGSASAFNYLAIPVVTSVSPNSGSVLGGTAVTLTGSGFSGVTSVTFGGVPATALNVLSDTQLTCVTPAVSFPVEVNVAAISPGGTGTLTEGFAYTETPLTGQYAVIAQQTELLTVQSQWVRDLEDALKISPPGLGPPVPPPPAGTNLDLMVQTQVAAIRLQVSYASTLEQLQAIIGAGPI